MLLEAVVSLFSFIVTLKRALLVRAPQVETFEDMEKRTVLFWNMYDRC